MRKTLALAMVVAASSVNAAEELKFGDVNYFIKSGEINILADASSTYNKFTYLDTRETRGYIFQTQAGYGITDQLNVYFGLDYAYDLETENKDAPDNQDYSSDGFSNPSLAVNYRFMNQNSGMYNIDFGAIARVNVLDAESGYGVAGDSEDGNYLGYTGPRGSLELNARMGRKWNEANEWQLAAGYIYFNDGESDDLESDRTNEYDSSMDFYLRATYQYRPVENFMMLLSLQGTRIGESEGEIAGSDFTADAHVDFDFRFTAKYLITDNLIGKFNYGQGINSAYDQEVGNLDEEVRKRRESFYGLGVEFLF